MVAVLGRDTGSCNSRWGPPAWIAGRVPPSPANFGEVWRCWGVSTERYLRDVCQVRDACARRGSVADLCFLVHLSLPPILGECCHPAIHVGGLRRGSLPRGPGLWSPRPPRDHLVRASDGISPVDYWKPFPLVPRPDRSEEHTSELQSPCNLVCRLLLEQ